MLIKKDPDLIKNYFEDSSNLKGGHADEVVFPSTEEELAVFLKEANLKKTPVTISGGGTNTTGSRIPFGGAVISMEKLNRIIDVSEESMSALVQTGVMVEEIKALAEKKQLFYTSHPTERTASVGGTVATNASGARSFKYGPTRRYVKRLKMVLPTGQIFELRRGQRNISRSDSTLHLPDGAKIDIPIPSYKIPDVKSSAGYFAKDGMDLIDLFIGQEGTLSVITEIEIGLVRLPEKIFSCFVFFGKAGDAFNFSEEAKRLSRKNAFVSGGLINALSIEYFDSNALGLLRSSNTNIPAKAAAAIFFEQDVDKDDEDKVMNAWLEVMKKHGASLDDTWVAMSEKDADVFLELRHAVPESINQIVRGYGFPKLSTDIAVPDDKFAVMADYYMKTLKASGFRHVIFGHIGESHLHVNVLAKSEEELAKAREICLGFARKAVALGGTVSAEHGIGKIKHKFLEIMYGHDALVEMARIKKAFDPNLILGLGNILPKDIFDSI